jgi:chemotaxis protein CheX
VIFRFEVCMDLSYIVPFISSAQNVFSTMLQIAVTAGEPIPGRALSTRYAISGTIKLSGGATGTMSMRYPIETADALVRLFTGTTIKPSDPDFADAIGELANMVCGGAKWQLGTKKRVSISCPTVEFGEPVVRPHDKEKQKEIPCIQIPCSTECGPFVIEVAIRRPGVGAAKAKPAGNARAR